MGCVVRFCASATMASPALKQKSRGGTPPKKTPPKKGSLIQAMITKHEIADHEQDLHLAPAVRAGKRDLENALESRPDRRGLEARGILPSEDHPGFSAAAALQKAKSAGAIGEAAPAAEASIEEMREDTVASRVQDLYDKIRADPDVSKSREMAVAVENNALAKVELAENNVSTGGARQEEICERLKTLDERFTKAQSIEAEKYKVLRMLVMRIQEDAGIEKVSIDIIKERYDREVRSIESSILLDLNVHRQARRDLDKNITAQIDDKLGIFSAELAEERQERMEAATRVSFDPVLVPTLTSNIEQEGTLRYDRGEQLLEKIREKTVNLHNMLSVEEDAHQHIEEFTEQIAGRCAELKSTIGEEKNHRAAIEARHAQRMGHCVSWRLMWGRTDRNASGAVSKFAARLRMRWQTSSSMCRQSKRTDRRARSIFSVCVMTPRTSSRTRSRGSGRSESRQRSNFSSCWRIHASAHAIGCEGDFDGVVVVYLSRAIKATHFASCVYSIRATFILILIRRPGARLRSYAGGGGSA